jgi:hypothetical protein
MAGAQLAGLCTVRLGVVALQRAAAPPHQPVPDLTIHRRIKLNARLPLRRYAEALSVIASDIALVRVQRGAAVGRPYSARRLRSQLGWF